MKRLGILRHAKSSWDDPDLGDFNRPLDERGWKAARRMGREFTNRGWGFDLVLASTAARVRETIDGVEEKFDFGAPVRFEPHMYMAGEGTLLALVRDLPETVHRPLLVGHNPGLQRLLVELSSSDERLRKRIELKFPTAAFAMVEFPAQSWNKIEPASGRIVELILPKKLD